MRRPGLWVANGEPGDVDQMLGWRPGAIASFYEHLSQNNVFEYKTAHPDVPVIVRFRHPPRWHQDPNRTARQLGQYIANRWDELAPLDPYVYFASHLNMHYENGDPNPARQHLYTTPEFYQRVGQWVQLTATVIKEYVPEMKLVAPPFAFGFNEDGSPDSSGTPIKGWAGYDFLYEAVRDYFDNVITFHAYWGYPVGGSVPDWLYEPELASWYAFRWQRVLQLFEQRYGLTVRVLIDEVASFGPGDPDFTDQLIYYAEQCLSDPRVLALTYFLWSDTSTNPRYRLNAWTTGVPDLAGHLRRLAQMPDVTAIDSLAQAGAAAVDLTGILDFPEPPSIAEPAERDVVPSAAEEPTRTIRVLFEDNRVEVMLLEEYLRGVVPGEVPAAWPEEALKAQAVAARSYARYAIEHPRHHPTADICTTTHCQHYAPDKIHPRSDAAVRQTQGLIIRYDGEPANAVFSARCGGHTRNNEDVWKGRPTPYLRGVPCPDKGEKRGHGVGFCQHGARVFAQQGRPFDEIVRHYYQGVTIEPDA